MKESSRQWWIQYGRNLWAIRYYALVGLMMWAVLLSLILLISNYGPSVYAKSIRVVGRLRVQLFIGISATIMGFAAYQFKRINQRWYGVVEVAFGMATAFAIARNLYPADASLSQWSSLIGSSYDC